MTPEQTLLVQESFALVAPIADTAASLFYGRLFELDPALRPLFPGDLREQRRKLMQMIAVAVRELDAPERLLPAVRTLGRRHVGYGVRPEHYATVGAALLWTLKQGLGAAFTPEVEAAWAEAYGLLATTMQQGALSEAA
jgi:hemoglobin-like flavoprotein